MRTCSETELLAKAIDDADAIVVGAGSGLSTSAGKVYDGERFHSLFPDFEERYGFHDMYAGTFYRFPTQEERWAYMSRHIMANRYTPASRPVHRDLMSILEDREYFVVTTNVDHLFQRAGIDRKRLFYTQGDYGLFQCSRPCCQETWDNEDQIRRMAAEQSDCRIPSSLIPVCPKCGAPAMMNLRCDDRFAEDEGWHRAAERYENFLRTRRNQKVLYLELGVGYNTPAIIKYPFWQMTAANPKATYACVNLGDARYPTQIAKQSIGMARDIGDVISEVAQLC
ncbi:MAG: Sir2 family NAD-dependent protein deacetylase [Thermoplasmata archaeon]|nr:Sir2 family NAD-dependent protein deacetylase [Thermoplasmata archaeon]